jgi:hypothetical protein
MKKILLILSLGFIIITSVFADLRDNVTGAVEDVIPNVQTGKANLDYVAVAKEVQFWIFAFIGIIAVAYILWIGAKLLWAPGNTEEITTSLKSLGYVVAGLALIPFAYFIIQFIINLRL